MTDDPRGFHQLVDRITLDRGNSGLRPVIEKELLHYEILFALEREGLLESLVFQGGTSLRLCYGSSRFSEDLDFSGGPGFSAARLNDIAAVLQHRISSQFGFRLDVKHPKDPVSVSAGVRVATWRISIETRPERRDLPAQRIKLDIDNSPSYTNELRPLRSNYDLLPDGYGDVLLNVQTMEEILANKLVAFPSSVATRDRPRFRDIWDMQWLRQRNVTLRPDLVRLKIEDHAIADYDARLSAAIERSERIVHSPEFRAEMLRFLPPDVVAATLDRAGFLDFLSRETGELLKQLDRGLREGLDPGSGPAFEL